MYSVAPSNTTISVPEPVKLETVPFDDAATECESLDNNIVSPLDPSFTGAIFIVSKASSI